MEAQQLTCPQLLSDDDLRRILKDRCIEIEKFDEMDKPKLIELFKRVVLPQPQRKYNENRLLGRSLQSLRIKRKIKVVDYEEHNDISTTVAEPPPMCKNINSSDNKQNNRLKPPINDSTQVTKRIRLSSGEQTEDKCELRDKKRTSDVPLTDTKKRQKITWP